MTIKELIKAVGKSEREQQEVFAVFGLEFYRYPLF